MMLMLQRWKQRQQQRCGTVSGGEEADIAGTHCHSRLPILASRHAHVTQTQMSCCRIHQSNARKSFSVLHLLLAITAKTKVA